MGAIRRRRDGAVRVTRRAAVTTRNDYHRFDAVARRRDARRLLTCRMKPQTKGVNPYTASYNALKILRFSSFNNRLGELSFKKIQTIQL